MQHTSGHAGNPEAGNTAMPGNHSGVHSDDDFIADPTGHMLAVIDDHQRAAEAERELMQARFPEARLYLGSQGVHALDPHGTEHGPGELAVRLLEQATTNKDNLADYAQAIEEGSAVVAFVVPGGREDEAVAMLERYGAHTINHFGTLVVRTLRP